MEDYLQRGANQKVIDSLKDASKQEELRELNGVLENAKQTVIQTLGEKNLIEEAEKEMTTENLEEINDTMTEVRNGIVDGLKNLTQ